MDRQKQAIRRFKVKNNFEKGISAIQMEVHARSLYDDQERVAYITTWAPLETPGLDK